MGINFDGGHSVVKQNSYAIKIVNAEIVYELHTWPNNPIILH